jgi:hypothetical protein
MTGPMLAARDPRFVSQEAASRVPPSQEGTAPSNVPES